MSYPFILKQSYSQWQECHHWEVNLSVLFKYISVSARTLSAYVKQSTCLYVSLGKDNWFESSVQGKTQQKPNDLKFKGQEKVITQQENKWHFCTEKIYI